MRNPPNVLTSVSSTFASGNDLVIAHEY